MTAILSHKKVIMYEVKFLHLACTSSWLLQILHIRHAQKTLIWLTYRVLLLWKKGGMDMHVTLVHR